MLTIIDYGMGNLRSVQNAFNALGVPNRISSSPEDVETASSLILPGVGAFGDGMANLHSRGLVAPLNEAVLVRKKKFLGICLGMQFVAESSDEHGDHKGLGWIEVDIKKVAPSDPSFLIPHIGWNNLSVNTPNPLFTGLEDSPAVYFVHSHHAVARTPKGAAAISSTCEHGLTVTASLQQDNIFGVQFHPEKSQRAGLQILKNFVALP